MIIDADCWGQLFFSEIVEIKTSHLQCETGVISAELPKIINHEH